MAHAPPPAPAARAPPPSRGGQLGFRTAARARPPNIKEALLGGKGRLPPRRCVVVLCAGQPLPHDGAVCGLGLALLTRHSAHTWRRSSARLPHNTAPGARTWSFQVLAWEGHSLAELEMLRERNKTESCKFCLPSVTFYAASLFSALSGCTVFVGVSQNHEMVWLGGGP